MRGMSAIVESGGGPGVSRERGRVRLRTLVTTRWVAIGGQATALLVAHFALGYRLPIWWALATVAASAVVNLWAAVGRRPPARIGDREAALYLAYDLVQLGVLLFLTGGLHNPFAMLILAPVTVSATILSRGSTIYLTLLAIGIVAILATFHLPLPWPTGEFTLEPIFILGLALALALSLVFIAVYVFRVAEEARRMSDAFAAAQMALDREQRLSALGGLAAAAAHGLGSPLGTIAVVARELDRDLPADSPLRPDVELLLSQCERCRDILTRLAARPEVDAGAPFSRMPIAHLIEEAAAPHRTGRVGLVLDAGSDGPASTPQVARSPELVHGLGNLIQNALQFARRKVRIAIRWDDAHIMVAVEDDGPGFEPGLLDHLGEPYLSGGAQGRAGEGEHMGLGIFIAQTLLQRTGATLRFANRRNGGAAVEVSWPRSALAAKAAD